MAGKIRIIAGRWKRRWVEFPVRPGLRPTPDRVRETLFNWLHPDLKGARCLDLFAGSGVLGFEAVSRGAASVIMVEQDPVTVGAIRRQCDIFCSDEIEVVQADVAAWLAALPPTPVDIVFLDPPYQQSQQVDICRSLEQCGWLSPRAHIYLETHRRERRPELPPCWEFARSARAGQVQCYLALRTAKDDGRMHARHAD